MFKLLVFSFVSSFTYFSAWACGVPVCDIPTQIAEIRKMSSDERASYLLQLDESTKDSKDPLIVKNILDFSTEALPVVLELDKPVYWIISMVSDMINRSNLFLSTRSTVDLSADNLFDWYKNFVTDSAATYRFQVLTFWSNQLKNQTVGTIEDLRALIKFMNLAADYSISINDEEYVSNLARSVATESGLQMMRLRPSYEGVYSVKVTCDPVDQTVCPKLDTFSLLLGDDWRGIQAAFIQKDEPRPVFEFTEVLLKDEITIVSTTGPLDDPFAPAGFTIVFDVEKQTFSGVLITSRTEKDVKVEGKLIISPSKWFKAEVPEKFPELSEIAGKYVGQVIPSNARRSVLQNRTDIEIIIKSFGKDTFKATIRDSGNKDVLYDFSAGYYTKKAGAVSFFGGNDDGVFKMTLAYRIHLGKKRWVGILHSLRTGKVTELYFELPPPSFKFESPKLRGLN